MLLYVIRHGDPIYDPDSLTEKGHLQAKALAKRLSVHGLDRVFVSPLQRARQTAQPTCDLLGLRPEVEEWTSEEYSWRDFSFKDENGRQNWCFHIQTTEYKTEKILAKGDKWYEEKPFSLTNAKSGWERICSESDSFLSRLGYVRDGMIYRIASPNDMRVAVFCHQGFGTTWLAHLLSIPPVLFWSSFDLNHSSVTILNFENNKNGLTSPMCIALSDTSHIYADRLPLTFDNSLKI